MIKSTRLLLLSPLLLLACATSSKLADLAPTKTAVLHPAASTTKTVDTSATPSPDLVVCTDALNVRSGPALTAPVVAWLRRGNRVRVLESAGDWSRIGLGWVRGVYLC